MNHNLGHGSLTIFFWQLSIKSFSISRFVDLVVSSIIQRKLFETNNCKKNNKNCVSLGIEILLRPNNTSIGIQSFFFTVDRLIFFLNYTCTFALNAGFFYFDLDAERVSFNCRIAYFNYVINNIQYNKLFFL